MAKKEVKTNKKEKNIKNKRSFGKDFKAELKKVVWPTPKQLVNNTVAVITIVLITAVIVFALDVVFETLNKHGVEKVKAVITSSITTIDSTTESGTEEINDEEKNAEASEITESSVNVEENDTQNSAE